MDGQTADYLDIYNQSTTVKQTISTEGDCIVNTK